jgi:hypothetical protein
LFNPESVILLVDSLHAEAVEAVKSRGALSASTPTLFSILSDIKLKAMFLNRSQSVNYSSGSKFFFSSIVIQNVEYVSISCRGEMNWTLWS